MAWLPTVTTAAPASEPITVAEAKTQCRILTSDFDDYLGDLIQAARAHVEKECSLRIVSQTVEMKAGRFHDLYVLPVRPITAISAITYLDGDGTEQTLSTSIYRVTLAEMDGAVLLKPNQYWPAILDAPDAVKVTATAGFTTVPENLKRAMLLMVSDWFSERERPGASSGAVDMLLSAFRV